MIEVFHQFREGVRACVRSDDGRCLAWFKMSKGRCKDACCLALEKFDEDADILTDFAHMQERPSNVGPETSLECVRHAIEGMLYDDDACTVLRSPRGLEQLIAVILEVIVAFGDHLRKQDRDHVHANSACTGNPDIFLRHGAKLPPDNLLHLFGRRRH